MAIEGVVEKMKTIDFLIKDLKIHSWSKNKDVGVESH